MGAALITGASSGIGAAFAKALAQRSMDLLLVARNENRLQQLAANLRADYGVQVAVVVQDLTQPEGATAVYKAFTALGWTLEVLINNAGFGDYGTFGDRPRQKQLDMIQLNVTALVDLTHQCLPLMQAQGSGRIVNVASIAGFQSMPYLSVYAATKAFVLSFSEALWAENQTTGVQIMVVCPGPTETRFFEAAEFPSTLARGGQAIVSAERVVQEALDAFQTRKMTVITGGLGNRIMVNAGRFLPRQTLVKGIAKLFRPS